MTLTRLPSRQTSRASRLAFHWRARGRSLTPLTAQTPTFARTTASGLVPGYDGVLVPARARDTWVWGGADLDADGIYERAALRLEGQRTNLVLRSQEFDNASWAKSLVTVSNTTLTAPDASASADRLTATGAAGTVRQSVTFTGNATKAISLYVKVGSGAVAHFGLWDDTASAWRHKAAITWTAGVPALSTDSGAGTLYPVVKLADGWYRIAIGADGVIAANTNYFYVYPDFNGTTGNMLVWGAQAEDATFPSSYVPTAGSTVTRNADDLYWAFGARPQALTLYANLATRTPSAAVSDLGICAIGGQTAGGSIGQLFVTSHNNQVLIYLGNGSAGASAGLAATFNPGDQLEVRAVLNSDGSGKIGRSINAGAETTNTVAAPTGGLGSTWNAERIYLISATTAHFCDYLDYKVALGAEKSLASMRSLW